MKCEKCKYCQYNWGNEHKGNFETLDSAKSFAEKWYCDEIKKFFSIK